LSTTQTKDVEVNTTESRLNETTRDFGTETDVFDPAQSIKSNNIDPSEENDVSAEKVKLTSKSRN